MAERKDKCDYIDCDRRGQEQEQEKQEEEKEEEEEEEEEERRGKLRKRFPPTAG